MLVDPVELPADPLVAFAVEHGGDDHRSLLERLALPVDRYAGLPLERERVRADLEAGNAAARILGGLAALEAAVAEVEGGGGRRGRGVAGRGRRFRRARRFAGAGFGIGGSLGGCGAGFEVFPDRVRGEVHGGGRDADRDLAGGGVGRAALPEARRDDDEGVAERGAEGEARAVRGAGPGAGLRPVGIVVFHCSGSFRGTVGMAGRSSSGTSPPTERVPGSRGDLTSEISSTRHGSA